MKSKINNVKNTVSKTLTFVLFILCLCLSFTFYILTKVTANANADTVSQSYDMERFSYLSKLEKSYREQNPEASPEEVVEYLENNISNLHNNEAENINLQSDSSIGDSTYKIFGKTITSAEIGLVAAYPAQAVIAFNASEDAVNMIGNFYDTSQGAWLNNADALRHAYWNALMEKRISKTVMVNIGTPDAPYYTTIQVDFAKEFSDAHEYGSSGVDCEMDLRNNALGRIDGATYRDLDDYQLAYKITERISFGNYWRVINHKDVDGEVVGDLVNSDWTGLLPEVFDEIMYETEMINSSEIRLNKLNWEIEGSYTIPETIKGKAVTEIGDNAFHDQEGMTDITFPETVVVIGNNAFSNCKKLISITGFSNIQNIGSRAFESCESLADIAIPATTTHIGDGAFTGCVNLNITVSSTNSNFSAQGNILYNKSKTQIIAAGKVSSTVDIPISVASISAYAFASNRNIYTVNFKNTPKIGDYAFADCVNLDSVYFDTYTAPVVGKKVFENDNFVIYVPYEAQSTYKIAFAEYSNKIKSQEIAVFFVSDGVTISTQHLYYGSVIDFFTPEKTGNNFGGWYSNSNFTGTPYKNGEHLEVKSNLTVYAKWTPKEYKVTLDSNGGTIIGNNSLTVTYGSKFKTTSSASRTGYTFDGWYDNKKSPATQYITTAGESTKEWDIDENVTLYAHWIIESYEIQINDNGTITWLGASGLSDTSCTIEYGTVLSAINLVPTFKASNHGFKEGRIFDHFEYNDATINWTSIPDLGKNGAVITIKPVWILEVHTIYFNTNSNGNINVDPIEAEYNANISLPNITRKGYIFGSWYMDSTLANKINWVKMPDLTPNDQNNGSVQLYAKWSAVVYTISYLPNGGIGTTWSEFHTYDTYKTLRANTFTREGYNFAGWSTSATGNVVYTDKQTVSNLSDRQAGNIDLYAVWQPKTYSIICKNLATNMFVDIDTYTYGKGLEDIMPTLYKREGIYSMEVEKFYGWYTTAQFTTRVRFISEDSMGNITLYAKYDYYVQTDYKSSGTVTDSNINNQPYSTVDLYLKSFRYDMIKSTTLTKIKIKVSLTLWEVNDGYQDFCLYNGSTKIAEKTIEHGGNGKDGNPKYYVFEFSLNIKDYLNVDVLYLRLGAHGAFADTWEFEDFEMNVYFTN